MKIITSKSGQQPSELVPGGCSIEENRADNTQEGAQGKGTWALLNLAPRFLLTPVQLELPLFKVEDLTGQ